MQMTCTATGLDAVDRGTRVMVDRVKSATAGALYGEMVGVMAVSQDLCPVESGALRDSGAVSTPEDQGNRVTVFLGYGGDKGQIVYALIQHERLDYRHASGKEAKFLERPLLEWAGGGLDSLAQQAGASL